MIFFRKKYDGVKYKEFIVGSMLLQKGWKEEKTVDIKVISEISEHEDISETYNI